MCVGFGRWERCVFSTEDGKCFWERQATQRDRSRESEVSAYLMIICNFSRMINKAIRELDKETKNLERSAKRLEGDIKKAGRDNQIVRRSTY
jgi:hypothetical protein